MAVPQTLSLKRCLGSLLALAASFCSALNGLVFVFLEPAGFGAVQCVFYRLFFLGLVMAAWVKVKGEDFICRNPYVWLGSVLWTVQVLFFYAAISYSYVYADVVTISFLSVALIAILGWLILGEKFDAIDLVLILFIIVGGAIVVQPEFLKRALGGADNTIPERCFEENALVTNNSSSLITLGNDVVSNSSSNMFYNATKVVVPRDIASIENSTGESYPVIKCDRTLSALFATLSTIFVSLWYIVSRKTKDVFNGTVVLYNSFIGIVISSSAATILGVWTFRLEVAPWLWMFAFCVSGGLGFVFKVAAFQHEKAAVVAIVKSAQIIFSYALGVIFLHEIPTAMSSIGAMTVFFTCSGFCVRRLWKEAANTKIADSDDDENYIALLDHDDLSRE